MPHTAGDFESLLAAAKGIATDVAAKHAADVDAKARFPQESIDAMRRAKLLYLNYPGNPTAAIAPREYL